MLGLCLAPRRRPTELQPLGQAAGSTVAAVEMESKQISANEADEILQKWVTQSQRVCFAVCVGGIAWHSHWVGTLRSASMGRWVLTAGHTTNMLCTNQYQEIIQTEDDDLVGLRFAQPHGFTVQGFEVDLFVEKHDGHEEQYGPLINRIIQ
jgi:hypothetical protein